MSNCSEGINYLNYEKFDMKTVSYDVKKYNFHEWVVEALKEEGIESKDLSLLHEVIDPKKLAHITKSIISKTNSSEFLKIANSYISEIVHPMVDYHPIGVQRFFNFRILLPNQELSLIPFHNGQLQGHGLGERTTWMPLTDAYETSSLYLMNIEESRALLDDIRKNRTSYTEFQKILESHAKPANIGLGEAKVFTQENIHGSIPNVTGKTRVSFDFRVLLKGGEFGYKLPGGYFRNFN